MSPSYPDRPRRRFTHDGERECLRGVEGSRVTHQRHRDCADRPQRARALRTRAGGRLHRASCDHVCHHVRRRRDGLRRAWAIPTGPDRGGRRGCNDDRAPKWQKSSSGGRHRTGRRSWPDVPRNGEVREPPERRLGAALHEESHSQPSAYEPGASDMPPRDTEALCSDGASAGDTNRSVTPPRRSVSRTRP